VKRLTQEWLDLAEGDLAAATREAAVTDHPFPSGVCFHAQQSVEKLMKAVPTERGVRFDKTHDLRLLADLIWGEGAEPSTLADADLALLQPGAVEYRYPGDQPDMEDARAVLEACTRVRAALVALL
jgi:HEPN domain-containing protein